ncbi:MAG TPA: hypothetical protein VFK02_04945 [Kofleriaceae bacterium]|nr:hypothetical protein [Kofleriaceae bacterium]
MIQSEQPSIVTLLAAPPAGTVGPTDNLFIDHAYKTLRSRKATGHRIIRVASVRDADVEMCKILSKDFKGTVRLQIVGHSISGVLSLGGSWIPEEDMVAKAFKYPYYVLDTNPASLGLLAKYAGKISEVMLVGCNVGSSSSFGYAINGRTLTYTLAELLRCMVRGADDIVSPNEFDAQGWYEPQMHHRRAKGWRWTDARPPAWVDPGLDPTTGTRTKATKSFEVRAVTRSLLPGLHSSELIELNPPIQLTCEYVAPVSSPSALPEISVETDQGPAHLLCGGRYLRWLDNDYLVDQSPHLPAALTAQLAVHRTTPDTPVQLTSVAG